MSENYLLLKWGTVKEWSFEDPNDKVLKLLQEYLKDSPASCMSDRPDGKRKKLLCDVIDKMDGEIMNDWSGEIMTKKTAKDYIMNYGD